jgi:putative peptide zinc metalloprotease protein
MSASELTDSSVGPRTGAENKHTAVEHDLGLVVRRAEVLDIADQKELIVCELSNGSCVRMSASAYWLYIELQNRMTAEQIAATILTRFGQRVDVGEIASACAGLVDRVRDASKSSALAARRRYAFRVRLLPESMVTQLARRLTWLVSRPAVALSVSGIVASAVVFYAAHSSALGVEHLNLTSTVIAAYLIYLLALFSHELGHAAACVRYGVSAGEIGFAIYLIFPAVYCDVTRSWLLPRRRRVVVDIAGIWLETGVGAMYLLIGTVLHMAVFVLAAFMVLGNLLIALNPLGRFDSYWLLSDALGISDLSSQRTQMLRRVFGGRGRASDAWSAGYGRYHRRVIVVYSIVTGLALGYYIYLGVRLSGAFVGHLEAACVAIDRSLERGRDADGLVDLAKACPAMIMSSVMLYRVGRLLVTPLTRARRAIELPERRAEDVVR